MFAFLMRNLLRTLLTVRCILEVPRQVFLFFLLKMLWNGIVDNGDERDV